MTSKKQNYEFVHKFTILKCCKMSFKGLKCFYCNNTPLKSGFKRAFCSTLNSWIVVSFFWCHKQAIDRHIKNWKLKAWNQTRNKNSNAISKIIWPPLCLAPASYLVSPKQASLIILRNQNVLCFQLIYSMNSQISFFHCSIAPHLNKYVHQKIPSPFTKSKSEHIFRKYRGAIYRCD